MSGITVGIDLGTTNSVISVKKINITTIRNAEGEELTPSCVTAIPGITETGFDFVVGRNSRDLLKQYPRQTITSVKRLMGRDFEDPEVQSIIQNHAVSYEITTDASEPGSIFIPLGGKMQTPEMISGIILNKLIRDGETDLQGKIEQAVVTVPAYFSDRQKFATRAACDYAGIKLLRLLPEPTAAALSFGLDANADAAARTIMVFDLGGGTFDISILSCAGGSFMEVTKGGDMWLGGDNIDRLLIEHIFSCAQATAKCQSIAELVDKLAVADRARFLAEIKEKAEAAKIELSTQESATVEMFGILKDEKNKLLDIDVTITREEFNQLIQPIVARVAQIATQILHEIHFEAELIDTVLMVGGSSFILAIQQELKTMFGAEKVMVHPRPMLAIAEGAALMAAKMTSQEDAIDQFAMMHSTAHDYYLQLANGKRHLLVARNTPLPISVEEKFSFAHSEQVLARLRVFNAIDGVMDTVGELWFHRESVENVHDIDISRNVENKGSDLMLRFSVDEDNIITMKAWSLANQEFAVEAQIARGGLAAKLYNDLERTLSSIVANCDHGSVEYDALCLSRTVVSTILSASDPVTGETCVEYKQKAQRQINVLQDYQQRDLSPLSNYKFGLIAQVEAAAILTSEEKISLQNTLVDFKQALEILDDGAKLDALITSLDEFFAAVPTADVLARAENAAQLLETGHVTVSRNIRKQAANLVNLHLSRQPVAIIKNARDGILELCDSIIDYSAPSGRFYRDVCL